jgi:hypothetical protein
VYKIGDVEVHITDESEGKFSEVTERPVESGVITDNVKRMPDTVELTGTVTSDGWAKKQALDRYQEEGTLITYSGKATYENMVIESFDTDYISDNKDGFGFSMTLKEVRITGTVIVDYSVAEDIQSQTKAITNAGLQTLRGG